MGPMAGTADAAGDKAIDAPVGVGGPDGGTPRPTQGRNEHLTQAAVMEEARARSVAAGDGEGQGDEQLTDGRQLRRVRNREAVVEALLDLYGEGNLQPGSEEIAERSGLSPRSLFRYFNDVDDLVRAAIGRQVERALPFVPVAASPDDPLDVRIGVLVGQRFSLFDAVGDAATVARLRSPFQPLLAAELAQNRKFLRDQLSELFARELQAMEAGAAAPVLAAVDVLTTFEAYRLLRVEQGLGPEQARTAVSISLAAILGAR